jgi:PBP1b-binding outer membrane lipoprotein LpoB
MKPSLAAAAALLLAGCATQPPPFPLAGPSPDDPHVRVAPARAASVTAGMVDHRPVAPKSWLERNDAVAPRSGGDR